MTTLRSLFFITFVSVQGLPALAAEEFEDAIPLDVAEALFDIGLGGRLSVYSDILEDFPPFQVPPGFEVMGSMYQIPRMRVALETDLDEQEATSTLLETFLNSGWVELPSFDRFRRDTGFVSTSQPTPRQNRVCHDEHGSLTYSFRERQSRNIVSLDVNVGMDRNWRSCDELIAQYEQNLAMMSQRGQGVSEYVPRLVVPEEARQGNRPPFLLGGISSSNNSVRSEASVELDWELEEVYRHFAEQITAQGWTLDTESIGTVTASGTWTRTVQQDVIIVGRFTVVDSSDQRFDLSLSVEGPGGRSGAGFILGN